MNDWALMAAIVVGLPMGLILLYAGVRIAGAAWFKSKQQFDNQPKGR